MGEAPDQIERHIQHQRSELEDNISELEEKVKSAFDWRTQFEERPAIFLGAAFLGGALLSGILPSASRIGSKVSSRRHSSSSSDPWTPYTNFETAPLAESHPETSYREGSGTNTGGKNFETWENLKNAALGIATTRLSEFIEELVPGFSEHYKKAASGRPVTPFSSMPSSGGPSGGGSEKNRQKPNGGTDYASHS
jgi:hypothetical protein